MWSVIAYKEVYDGSTHLRVYDDSTEKHFEVYEDAVDYSGYLTVVNQTTFKNTNVDMYETKLYQPQELDIQGLKRQDALNKLTQEEKDLLGIQ